MICCRTVDLGPDEFVFFVAGAGDVVVRVEDDFAYLTPFAETLVSTQGHFSVVRREPPSVETSFCVNEGEVLHFTTRSAMRFLLWRSPGRETTVRVSALFEEV